MSANNSAPGKTRLSRAALSGALNEPNADALALLLRILGARFFRFGSRLERLRQRHEFQLLVAIQQPLVFVLGHGRMMPQGSRRYQGNFVGVSTLGNIRGERSV